MEIIMSYVRLVSYAEDNVSYLGLMGSYLRLSNTKVGFTLSHLGPISFYVGYNISYVGLSKLLLKFVIESHPKLLYLSRVKICVCPLGLCNGTGIEDI